MPPIPQGLIAPLLTATGVMIGAVLAGAFALINGSTQHRRQYKEQRRDERQRLYVQVMADVRRSVRPGWIGPVDFSESVALLNLVAPPELLRLGEELMGNAGALRDGDKSKRPAYENSIAAFASAAQEDLRIKGARTKPRLWRRALNKVRRRD